MRLTFAKIQPDKMDAFRKIYNEEIVPMVKAQKGNLDIFGLEAVDEGEAYISFTSWDNKENGEAYEASGTYGQMVGKVKHTFTGPPTLKSYEVIRSFDGACLQIFLITYELINGTPGFHVFALGKVSVYLKPHQ